MTRQLSLFSIVVLALLLLLPHTTQAQSDEYDIISDFKLAWSLDPRTSPQVDLFTHGGMASVFGGRGVYTGMDFDDDGNKEFIFTTDETLVPGGPDPGVLDIFLYENTGDDQYEYVWHYSYSDSSNSLPAVAWGDLDSDGLQEIYFGLPTLPRKGDPNDLFVFEQNPDGTFPDEPTTSWGYERAIDADFRPAAMQIADVDGDGQDELITGSRTSGARELVVASPNGAIDAFTTWTIELDVGEDILGGGAIYDLDTVDYDGDGNIEIWVSTWDNLSMTIYEATGADTYELQVDINEAADPVVDHGSHNVHDMNFFDIDEDGMQELIWPTTSGELFILNSTDDVSTLGAADFVSVGFFDSAGLARGSDIGDLDGDGALDIVTADGFSETISRIEYRGSGNPTDSTSWSWSVILDSGRDDETTDLEDRWYPLRIADDLDGDGLNEIVATNLYSTNEGMPIVIILEATSLNTAAEESDVPKGYVLEQNYPNPFNPSTTISYVLPQSEQVSLKVYNLTGQLVRTLIAGATQPAGRNTFEWNGRDDAGAPVASGIYVYTLEAGATRISKQMVLLK